MLEDKSDLARLYLPLLTSSDPQVRQHVHLLMAHTHGPGATAILHELIAAPECDEAGLDGDLLYVQCLGRFSVRLGNRALTPEQWLRHCEGRAGLYKAQQILAYLVHCGRRGVSRDTLERVIWQRQGQRERLTRALRAVQAVLAELSPTLAELLIVTPDYCMLNPDGYSSDDRSFEQCFQLASEVEMNHTLAAAAPFYRQALRGYDGPYMLAVPGSAAWGASRRELLASQQIIACERLVELAFRQGRYWECLRLCRETLETDYAAEELVAWLLRTYHALGQYAELEHSYRFYLQAQRLGDDEGAGGKQADPVTATYRALAERPRERAVG